ncbi:MAG TPA: FumA C-terminus/TtdB family hydratase beta subunit [Spirochaetota bacterium]|nr:FumA C-terminus/TtdB family hydratase beta subunit [Spirochaetota bacterium]HPP04339.1 FumA C-terminus/TtdB family hydratase beta subunit [Spirochaetota bacterium]
MDIKINIDKDFELLKKVKSGDLLYLSGELLVARDAAHKRIKEYIDNNKELPFDLKNKIIYYMGPTPAKPGLKIGSCGPTSSYRMDDFLEMTLKMGVVATIGKGERADFVTDLIKKYKSPYLSAFGGAGAYLAKCVIDASIIAFDDLQSEAVMKLIVKDFPVIVTIDAL